MITVDVHLARSEALLAPTTCVGFAQARLVRVSPLVARLAVDKCTADDPSPLHDEYACFMSDAFPQVQQLVHFHDDGYVS